MRMTPRVLRTLLLAVVLTALAPALQTGVLAQSADQKKPLTIEDYGRWRSISGAEISADGAWVAFSYQRGEPTSDDTLYV